MAELFRGCVIKDWKNADVNCKEHKSLNKIVACRCVKCYNECWKDRNAIMHDENKQKIRLKRWYENEKREAEQSEHRQVKLYVQRCKIDVNQSNCETIKKWIRNLKQIEKKVKKIPLNDIRRWMIV